jgi:hypothetical protein
VAKVIDNSRLAVFLPLGCHDPGNHVSLPSKTSRRGTLER